MSASLVAPTRPHRQTVVPVQVEARGAPGRLYREGHGEIIISGPAGTGKTRAIFEFIHYECSTYRKRWLIVRKTQESLKASALVTFREQVLYKFDGRKSVLDGVRYFGGNDIMSAQFVYDRTGSVIEFTGMDRPTKVDSTEWDGIYVNECNELTLAEWETLGGRTDRPSMTAKKPSLLLGDCNPDAPTHWIRQRAKAGLLKLWFSRHEDNPAMYDIKKRQWTDAGLLYLARLDKLTGVRRLRKRLGIWAAAEGQIYEQWDESVHVIDRRELPAEWDRFLVLDFGFTNPFVLQCWALDPDGRMILEHEIYRTRRLVSDHAADWLAFWGTRRSPIAVIADHDAEDRATWEQATGLATISAKKDVSPGLQAVQNRIKVQPDGKPRLMIMRDALIHRPDDELRESGKPTCTADEALSYVWDPKAKKGEQPLKRDDHGMDGCRYGAMALDGPDDAAEAMVVYDDPVSISEW